MSWSAGAAKTRKNTLSWMVIQKFEPLCLKGKIAASPKFEPLRLQGILGVIQKFEPLLLTGKIAATQKFGPLRLQVTQVNDG